MATLKQSEDFIKAIAPLLQKYAKENGYSVCSPFIAMACVESAYGLSKLSANYHNYFGMKCGSAWTGASVNMKTGEEYTPGVHTTINANFRCYPDMESGVRGFFEFLSKDRYKNVKTAKSAYEALNLIKADGYATSSTYVNTNMTVVRKWGLEKYDPDSKLYPRYVGTTKSIVTALSKVGELDTSKFNRGKIAAANGIENYTGTAEQNTQMLSLLKNGKLRRKEKK